MRPSKKLIFEIALILFLSAVLGFGTHVGFIKRYLKGEFEQGFISLDKNGGIRLITLREAEDLFTRGDALFIDSRPRGQYRDGHILGAKNVPLDELKGPEKNRPAPLSRLLSRQKRSGAKEGTSNPFGKKTSIDDPESLSPLSAVPRGAPLIVYCEGGDCQTSLSLAKILREYGFQDVRVCQDGWEGWTRAGLPQEMGEGDN